MQVSSIRDASSFVIGAYILRERALQADSTSGVTIENIATAALGENGPLLRSSIETLASAESAWLRDTPPHKLTTDRVLQTRSQEIGALNTINLSVIATQVHENAARAGDVSAKGTLRDQYQAAAKAVTEMPGSANERRNLWQKMQDGCLEIAADPAFVQEQINNAQRDYVERMRMERLAAYEAPEHEPSSDLDLSL